MKSLGWGISDSLTKNTTVLVVKDKNSGSSKIKKAQQIGIQIMTKEELGI